jgi:hypothetical protein
VEFLKEEPGLLDRICTPGLSFDHSPEVSLCARLREFGLLPEDKRKVFVETVTRFTVDGEDVYALQNDEIRRLFTEDEFAALLSSVETSLLPGLGKVRARAESAYSSGSAEERMEPLLETFSMLRKHFECDERAAGLIDREIDLTNEWIDEHTHQLPKVAARSLGSVEASQQPSPSRSIFDDIDQ